MGVDAEMFVRIPDKDNWLSKEAVLRLAYELGSSFSTDTFFTRNPTQDSWDEKRHLLEIIEPVSVDDPYFEADYHSDFLGKIVWQQDGEPIIADDDEQFIQVYLFGRFYGPGYERGDWPTLRAVISWLRYRIPHGSVWYGGDSSGICAEEADDDFLDEMDQHFCEHGRRPYVRYESPFKGMRGLPKDSIVPPVCPLCEVPLTDTGGSRDYTFYWCDGCGAKASKHFNGTTIWAKRHADFPHFDTEGNPIEEKAA